MLPILEQMLESFPFNILDFHSNNSSEYINRRVEELLERLSIDFTKSRSCHLNDNALAESKNASIVRKTFGYQHISQKWAPEINEFNRKYLNPYINYHRPCFFPEVIVDKKGKQRKTYPYKNMMTPYDKLKSILNAEQYLKPEISFETLDEFALQISDSASAELLKKERQKLFSLVFKQDKTA